MRLKTKKPSEKKYNKWYKKVVVAVKSTISDISKVIKVSTQLVLLKLQVLMLVLN